MDEVKQAQLCNYDLLGILVDKFSFFLKHTHWGTMVSWCVCGFDLFIVTYTTIERTFSYVSLTSKRSSSHGY